MAAYKATKAFLAILTPIQSRPELRQEHLGDGLPPGPSVRAEMEAADQRVVAGTANDRAGVAVSRPATP